MTHDDTTFAWWAALNHGGLLIAPAKLREFFAGELPPLSRRQADQLRRDVTQLRNADSLALTGLLDTVFEQVLGLDFRWWDKSSRVSATWSRQLVTGETLRPQRLCQVPGGATLPVFVAADVTRLGIGQGRRPVARVVEWQRKAEQPLALLTNGRQWRLIHAGSDYDAWCEWDIERWFEQGEPGLQITALRHLLGAAALQGEPPPLPAAIQATRSGQAELSGELGERVRQAVELLIRACAPQIDRLLVEQSNVTAQHVYIAANRVIMRCVFILFAEARELLPVDNPIYHDSYGLNGLRERLDRQGGTRAPERLRDHLSAWPRLLALFHLLYFGSTHTRMTIPTYGGSLFAPGDRAGHDPVRRALTAFEDAQTGPSDAAVYRLLQLLTRSRVKVRQGNRSAWVEAPVDFSDLSSEYIGILYQGLLDFELRQAAVDGPLLFLNVGDQPALPLARLEAMDETALAALLEKLKKAKQPVVDSEAEEAEAEADEEPAEDGEADPQASIEEEAPEPLADEVEPPDDWVLTVRARAVAWAQRAVEASKLVNRPRGRLTAAQQARYAADLAATAEGLIARVILPGEWFLVRWGGTRKGAGTFYTRPQLGVPLVRRTLRPLCYDEDGAPKAPEMILALKVCDSAMGSGSLLAAGLRYLTDALFESLYYHGRITAHGGGSIIRLADGQTTDDLLQESLPLPPDHPDFDDRLRARLKRYVVERCLYGVDLDPLAVELARLSLWIETMDRALPFSFLDHKLKCGNSLVGCWLDRFQDYPVMAWEREGGDQNHDRFVHHFSETTDRKGQAQRQGDRWTQAIKEQKGAIQQAMRVWIESLGTRMMRFGADAALATALHTRALATFEQMHRAALTDPGRQEQIYRRQFLEDAGYQQLRLAFDAWCAIWFWPGDDLALAPTPLNFDALPPTTEALVRQIAAEQRFFHWELEFPDVFNPQRSGFDALIENPPWENAQSNIDEFFSNVEPLFRTFGRIQKTDWMQIAFSDSPVLEHEWITYNARFKAIANWVKSAAEPFGETDGAQYSFSRSSALSRKLQNTWREHRRKRIGYASREHPFRLQMGRLFTYKLFLEHSYILLAPGGYLGAIVPSGIYSDSWSGPLRREFLENANWLWLFGFENRDKIFDIDGRFKFNPLIIQRGARGDQLRAAFMRRDLQEWQEAERHALVVNREQILRFSPKSNVILELQSHRDIEILEKIYENSVLLGDQSENGWGIKYALEFMMNTDAKLFPPRPKWEQQGYIADEYGHWLKGKWRPAPADAHILARERGTILSADGKWVISAEDVADVALPLYDGRMIGQFDFSQKGWVSGKGRTAIWREIPFEEKVIEPQFCMGVSSLSESTDRDGNIKASTGLKVGFMDIASATNSRTMFATLIPGYPCGNKVPVFQSRNASESVLCLLLNSFVYDYQLRARHGGLSLNYFILDETGLFKSGSNVEQLDRLCLRLAGTSDIFAPYWKQFRQNGEGRHYRTLWAVSKHERLRLRCILDAVVAHLYGLDGDDFAWILRQCDYPVAQSNDSRFTRALDVKGFWRVDKALDPELRHTVLSLVAFHDLQAKDLDAFLSQNNGEGWLLPETLRLADYGLGHDDRARQHQPVASRLGPRFLPWQLEGTPEQSWAECERHAENLRLLLGDLVADESAASLTVNEPTTPYPTNLLGEPVQTDLFGNSVQQRGKSRKRR